MAFSLPSDLATNFVDNSSNVDAAYFNGVSAMGNAIKAALGTIGYSTKNALVATNETTTSTSYTDLTTTSDSVTVPVGSSGTVLIFIQGTITLGSSGGTGYMAYDVSGANTIAATDAKALKFSASHPNVISNSYSAAFLETGLTAGFTTFKLKYKSSSGSIAQGFANRSIIAIPFPSTDGTHASGDFALDSSSAVSVGFTGAAINRPTYDALGAGYYNASTNTGGSFSHTGASGATPILAVGVGVSTADAVFSATYNGVAMTELGRVWATNTGSTGVILYGLRGACTGSAVTVAFTSSKNIDQAITMNCASYTNVGAFGKPVYAAGGATAPTVSTTSLTEGSLAVNGIQVQRSTAITGYNQTSRYADARGSYQALQFGECAAQSAPGATVTFSATTGNNWGEIVVPLLPTATPIMADKVTSTVSGSGTKNISSTTFQHTGTSGTTPVVAVAVESDATTFLSSTIACTYNGSAMTLIGYVPTYGTYVMSVALFAKVGACTGSQVDVVVTNSPNVSSIMAVCASYTNVASLKPPALQPATGSQPSLSITSAAGDRVVAASRNHASAAKGYSQITGTTRFNDNTYRVSAANPGTMFVADTPAASSGTSTAVSAYTTISYGQGSIGAALSAASPTSIAFDAVGGGGTKNGSGAVTWSHTIGGNFFLLFATYYNQSAFTITTNVGGVDISSNTDYATWYNSGGNYTYNRWWWLWNPPQGAQTVTLTYVSGGPIRSSQNSVSYTNVGAMGNTVISSGNSAGPTGTAWKMTTGGIYVMGIGSNTSSAISAFDKTQRWNQAFQSNVSNSALLGDTAGSTTDMTFTSSQTSQYWGAFIIPLIPTTYT